MIVATAPGADTRTMEDPRSIWNARYAAQELVNEDDWLERWRPRLPAPDAGPALDIGCGDGFETARLTDWGHAVTSTDIAEQALARSRQRSPTATHILVDARAMPMLGDASFALAIAHLSLHYFDRAGTAAAFAEIARVLRPGGLLLACVNADDDLNYGAPADGSAATNWERVLVDGVPKQFFSAAKLREVLGAAHWSIENLDRRSTSRYGAPKSVLELAARRR